MISRDERRRALIRLGVFAAILFGLSILARLNQ